MIITFYYDIQKNCSNCDRCIKRRMKCFEIYDSDNKESEFLCRPCYMNDHENNGKVTY